jgi:acylphosphatase
VAEEGLKRVVVLYSGRVQGVGFRATVRGIACGYDVIGMARNLPDGRVELVAEGARSELEAFLKAIAESELSGFIGAGRVEWREAVGGLRGFRIG